MRPVSTVPSIAAGLALSLTPALAQTAPAAGAPQEPAQSSLVVGALQIGSSASLEIAGFDINVARDRIVYSYFLKNTGAAELALEAAVALPDLRASADGGETWTLAASDPENPVGLTVAAGGAAATLKAETHAFALGVDRLAEIKAERLPLIPFGAPTDKALAGLAPEAVDRLAALGVVSPRDPAQPKEPSIAAWSLEVVQSWRLALPPGKTTPVTIRFTPVKAEYRLAKGDEQDIEDMKDDLCLTPAVVSALQARLKGGGAWAVSEFALADDAPTRWLDSPTPTVAVQKPKPDAIVAFCGLDEKTAGKPVALGAVPDDQQSNELRIAIFEPAK
ncbi:MAG: DUF4424 family protein [Roseiarcus sp.]